MAFRSEHRQVPDGTCSGWVPSCRTHSNALKVFIYKLSRISKAHLRNLGVKPRVRANGEAVPSTVVILEFDWSSALGYAVLHSPHSLNRRSLVLHAVQD